MDSKIAIGSWQRAVWHGMTHGGYAAPLALRGRAASYSGRYRRSLYAMLTRAINAGYCIHLTPGPRGGMSYASATVEATRPTR